ncbi:P pilus assembly protein, pilin FimA [Herbaspirillum sp. CF444]|uniref:fimbrial protein n=1 Tax=Herbaspirillum sp. CF444 TaxID=1144319 RepID=UPI00027233BC|nr:fimbrial protein [Herbaspirillum sp. CF444]EJL88741.1 P pilus assembly protein, pilin FimA [Herbaspirillum sp. CF444]
MRAPFKFLSLPISGLHRMVLTGWQIHGPEVRVHRSCSIVGWRNRITRFMGNFVLLVLFMGMISTSSFAALVGCTGVGSNFSQLWGTSSYSNAAFRYNQLVYGGSVNRNVNQLNNMPDGSVIWSAEQTFSGVRSDAPPWGDGDWVVYGCWSRPIALGGYSIGFRGYGYSGPGHSNEMPVWATPVKGVYLRMGMKVNGVNPLKNGTTILANARRVADGRYRYFFSSQTRYSATFELIKSGRVEPGSVIINGTGDGAWIGFSVGGVWVASAGTNGRLDVAGSTCSLSSPNVSMGAISASTFGGHYGYKTASVPFSLQFSNCADVSKIAYKFDAAEGAVDKKNGVFSLSSKSTAGGLALQISDQSGAAVPLGEFKTVATASAPSPSIPFSISYFQLEKTVKPGSADGKLIVTVLYN